MSRKRDVRDARFRDREPQAPSSKVPREPRPAPRPSTNASSRPPRGARSARPIARDDDDRDDDPDDDEESPEAPSGPVPWYLSSNVLIPGALALLLAGAFYAKFRPEPSAAPPPAASSDGGSAPAIDNPADAAPANPTPANPAPAPANPTPAVAVDAGVPLDPNPVVPAHAEPSTPDPLHGQFTLAQATEGLTGDGPLHADIITSMGTFGCEMLSQQAPNTVANFVGLARGRRDFWDPVAGQWTRRPFYNGSLFHRVIPDFMIQGGDILRSGQGDPGYEIADENVRPHDAAGLLCMANHGPNTGGAQFFITEVAKPHLDGTYSIFGRCTPTDLVGRITHVARSDQDRPNEPVYILRVDVRKGARPAQ
ncbi:MAG: peptidylprolyl isomerase [Polyangiales bacterium]